MKLSWRDCVAGLSVAGLLLPETIAYSGIAGLPVQHAIVAAIAGCAVYALFGQSRFAILIGLRRLPQIPANLIVIVAGIAAVLALQLKAHGVALVGPIDLGALWTGPLTVSFDDVMLVARFALPLVLILFAESWGTVRSISLRHGDSVDSNRELLSLGLTNLASAAAQGMPVGAGFSAAATNEAIGPQSRLASGVAALGLAGFSLIASYWFAFIPDAVLAAIIIMALTHAMSLAPFIRLFKLGGDLYPALAAAIGVLAFGVLNGMLAAIALSFAVFVRRLSTPHVMVLGRLAASHNFVDMDRHPEAAAVPATMILRPAQPLFFGNAEPVFAAISRRLAAAPGITTAIISLEESFDLDTTSLDALLEFDAAMQKQGLRVFYARMHDLVRDMLDKGSGDALVARSSFSVDDAVEMSLQQKTA